ncbi:hypothetical protein [Saccharothrix luteola]|uniref:hypothetical protein n=1 Tax=Saccharothrix luteola TaxID=2893018 RepID=UPI001E5B2647|nr:hypothetical protein [Saccharothrix luteola]MCC8249517.1 hypothetical protein [Saccharothrix luteola]
MIGVVSYSHDPEGKALAEYLVSEAPKHNARLLWDRDMVNPVSIQEWMTNNIEDYPVACVMSPDYTRRFGRGSESSERTGTLFESRAVLGKLFDHTELEHCPVIPVAMRDFLVDSAPHALKRLRIAKIDPATGHGVQEFFDRLRALWEARRRPDQEGSPTPEQSGVKPRPGCDGAPGRPRPEPRMVSLMRALETADPSSPEARSLVDEWLAALDTDPSATAVFPAVEGIVKSAGDVDLMLRVVDRCLDLLRGPGLLEADKRVKARIFICGRAWYLRRRGDLHGALRAASRGVALAVECGDQSLVALGKRCLARIHRGLAEEADADAREEHLAIADRFAVESLTMFSHLPHHGDEVGVCLVVRARIAYTRYRLGQGRRNLRQASVLADEAVKSVKSPARDRVRDYRELQILRAEIALARKRVCQAMALADSAVGALTERAESGASYAELLARAHLVRAEVFYRTRRIDTTGDVRTALGIFERLGLERGSAECRWILVARDRGHGLSRWDVRVIERLSPDPRHRLPAVEEMERLERELTGRRWWRRREWREVVERVRARHRSDRFSESEN